MKLDDMSMALLSGYVIESSKLKTLAYGFTHVIDHMVPFSLDLKSGEDLLDRTIKVTRSIFESASRSFWLDVNVLFMSLDHLKKLLELQINDFSRDNLNISLLMEYTYNMLRKIVEGMRFFINNMDIEKNENDEKKIDEFRKKVINDLWKLENFDTREKRFLLLLVVLSYAVFFADMIIAGISTSIKGMLGGDGSGISG